MDKALLTDHASRPAPAGDPLHDALRESRHRWRELVTLAADLAFETDAWGRFVVVMPDVALGWTSGTLLGQPGALLLAGGSETGGFDPFRVTAPCRHRRAWITRADGGRACLTFAVAPITDPDGRITGTRGFGIDMSELDTQATQATAALRRGEALDHILWRTSKEVLAQRMMNEALAALMQALGAEGAAVLHLPDTGTDSEVAHQAGSGAMAVRETACHQLLSCGDTPSQTSNLDGRPLMAVGCHTRFGARAGLAVWRSSDSRGWDGEDLQLLASAANIVRMVLEHESIQQEMVRQARTDPLTGLLNRRAFLEEIERHIDRLDRESQPGTLMFADLDHFKGVNDTLGHEVGDQVLLTAASMLRRVVRPSDLVARLGGDEFAVWMSGADQLTAAERADRLREVAPGEFAAVVGGEAPRLSMSIGIATRRPHSDEAVDSLFRRADMAMYDVKRNGRGHWRVSLREGD
jgi:diguanylate cyclase (GGDEF)-like protein